MDKEEEIKYIANALRHLYHLADKFSQAYGHLARYQTIDDAVRDLAEELSEHLDRIDRTLLIILDKLGQHKPDKRTEKITQELRQEIITNRRKSIQAQIAKHQANLNLLEEQSAEYGIIAPLELTNHIKLTEKKIDELRQELEFFEV